MGLSLLFTLDFGPCYLDGLTYFEWFWCWLSEVSGLISWVLAASSVWANAAPLSSVWLKLKIKSRISLLVVSVWSCGPREFCSVECIEWLLEIFGSLACLGSDYGLGCLADSCSRFGVKLGVFCMNFAVGIPVPWWKLPFSLISLFLNLLLPVRLILFYWVCFLSILFLLLI